MEGITYRFLVSFTPPSSLSSHHHKYEGDRLIADQTDVYLFVCFSKNSTDTAFLGYK